MLENFLRFWRRSSVTTLIEKVEKLIALTSSPSEPEARSAAFKACKLIRENKLKVVESEETPINCIECGLAFKPSGRRIPTHNAEGVAGVSHLKCWRRD